MSRRKLAANRQTRLSSLEASSHRWTFGVAAEPYAKQPFSRLEAR
jgi:hypothetical protein